MAFPKCFKAAAKRKSTTIIPMILLFIIAIIIMVLSVQQSTAYVSEVELFGTKPFEGWEENVCENVLWGFLSPFLFSFRQKVDCTNSQSFFCIEYDVDFGLIGCPWRERNTIFRLLIDSFVIVATILISVILITEKGTDIWAIVYWFHWILMLMMFVIFILDCDGLYSGYNSCLNEFNLDDGSSLLVDSDSDAVETTIECKLDPYIYTCLADLGAVIVGFCVWRISMFYKFDHEQDTSSSYDGDLKNISTGNQPVRSPSHEMAVLSPNQSTTGSTGGIVSPPTGSKTMTATPNPPSTAQTKKEDSPDPFQEYNAETTNNNDAGAEDYVNPFDD